MSRHVLQFAYALGPETEDDTVWVMPAKMTPEKLDAALAVLAAQGDREGFARLRRYGREKFSDFLFREMED